MILVTGGAGYIGSHTILQLLEQNYEAIIFDNFSNGHVETCDVLKKYGNIKVYKGDLKNFSDINKVFKENKIDAVLHFAAYIQAEESVKNPLKYYENNVSGTINLIKAMTENNVDKIVFSSTAATYGDAVYTPVDENHPQNPVNPYGQSKLMTEKILDDCDGAYGIHSVRLRYFNAAGADKHARTGEMHNPETHLIPNILKSTFEGGKTFRMYGTDYETKDGTCVRDYINVEDLAKAHVMALEYLFNGGETTFINLGTGTGSSVKEVFDACEKITCKKIPVDIMPRREGDAAVIIADNKKAKDILGWVPENDLNQSIKSAYDFEKTLH